MAPRSDPRRERRGDVRPVRDGRRSRRANHPAASLDTGRVSGPPRTQPGPDVLRPEIEGLADDDEREWPRRRENRDHEALLRRPRLIVAQQFGDPGRTDRLRLTIHRTRLDRCQAWSIRAVLHLFPEAVRTAVDASGLVPPRESRRRSGTTTRSQERTGDLPPGAREESFETEPVQGAIDVRQREHARARRSLAAHARRGGGRHWRWSSSRVTRHPSWKAERTMAAVSSIAVSTKHAPISSAVIMAVPPAGDEVHPACQRTVHAADGVRTVEAYPSRHLRGASPPLPDGRRHIDMRADTSACGASRRRRS